MYNFEKKIIGLFIYVMFLIYYNVLLYSRLILNKLTYKSI